MKTLTMTLLTMVLMSCTFTVSMQPGAGTLATQIGSPKADVRPGIQDLRDPQERARVDAMIEENARQDKYNPLEGPPTAYDIPLPPDEQGMPPMEEMQCEEPGTGAKDEALMLDPEYMASLAPEVIAGAPPWMDEVKLLECGIEDPLPPSMAKAWVQTPGVTKHWLVAFDRNNDGKGDAWIQLEENTAWPRFYAFDRTYNGDVNIVYEDTLYLERKEPKCNGISIHWSGNDVRKPNPRAES